MREDNSAVSGHITPPIDLEVSKHRLILNLCKKVKSYLRILSKKCGTLIRTQENIKIVIKKTAPKNLLDIRLEKR